MTESCDFLMTVKHMRHNSDARSAWRGAHLFIAFLILFFPLLHSVNAFSQDHAYPNNISHVLVLHSYHPGFPCTDTLNDGIQASFAGQLPETHIDIEYIDSKRHKDPLFMSKIVDTILHYKLEGRRYDLIIVSGNEALGFALEHRSNLLKDTPIVYCAANAYLDKAATMPGVYGIRSKPDMTGILKQIRAFHPSSSNIVVIGDTTDSFDRNNYEHFMKVAKTFAGEMSFDYWNNLPSETIRQRLVELPQDSVVVINGYLSDRAGNLLSFDEQNKLLRTATHLPLYSFWDVYLGDGIVGGPLTSPREQGRTAARMALSILKGNTLPEKLTTLNSVYMFDYEQLHRFNIPIKSIPGESRLINIPPSGLQVSKGQFWMALSLLAGSITISLILSRNIMNRRIAERMLRESEQKFRELSQQFEIILEGISDGLSLISPDMKVVWSNKGVETNFGSTLGTHPGDKCCKLLYNRTHVCEDCPAIQSFATGERQESVITTPDGRTLEVKAFPVADGFGTVTHVIMLASDITEKRQIQEDSIRAAKLASLGELSAGVAHEINNPNALILLNAELLSKVCRDVRGILDGHFQNNGPFLLAGFPYAELREEIPHLFAEMLDSADRIKRIVIDLKDFARADGPDLNECFDLNESVQSALRLAGNAIKNSTDNLATDLSLNLPLYAGSMQKIVQVVLNLVLNACQALPSKERGISISTFYHEERRACVVKIQDEGIGIDNDILPFITDPFFTTKRQSGGTGLGLSVSMRIVKDHGGDLEFLSVPGNGTTVHLYLPTIREVSTV